MGGLAGLIDDEFEEFGASGRRWDRDAVILALDAAMPRDAALESFAIESFTAAALGKDVMLVTYRSTDGARGGPARQAWRSSIWVRRDDTWRLRFHQGTPAMVNKPADA